MLIDLRELLTGRVNDLSVEYKPELEYFDTGVVKYKVLESSTVNFVISTIGKLRYKITGDGYIRLSIPCDRCLKDTDYRVEYRIDSVFDMNDDAGEEAREEQDYIDGYNLDADQLSFGEILINMPAKVLCKDNCKGLCPVCGADRNSTECGCDDRVLDPRMSVFKDILNNFKEV